MENDVLDFTIVGEKERLKEFLLEKLNQTELVKHFGRVIISFYESHNFLLFGGLDIDFNKSENKWSINFEGDLEKSLRFVNSKISVMNYLESLRTVVAILQRTLPEYAKGSSVSYVETYLNVAITFIRLKYELAALTGSKTYYRSDLGQVLIRDLGLAFAIHSGILKMEVRDFPNGIKMITLPFSKEDETLSYLRSTEVLQLINRAALQVSFSNNPYSINDFKDRYNDKIRRLFFPRIHPKLDFYQEMLKVNPYADLHEIFFYHTKINLKAKYLDNPLMTNSDRTRAVALKTLHGYYYLSDNKDTLRFMSLEEYDRKNII